MTAALAGHYNGRMFGFQKLLVLAAIIAAVWYGFKLIGRLDRARKARLESEGESASPAGAEDMERCAACDVFVAARNAASCGRDDCPYPGEPASMPPSPGPG